MAGDTSMTDAYDESPRSRGRLVVGLVLFVGIFYLLVNSMLDSGSYFLTVQQTLDRPVKAERPIRVKGTVVIGSYVHDEGTTVHTFKVKDDSGDGRLPVYYDGPMPDVFKEGGEVVVEGPRRADGTLTATEVTAKCPSKYEGGQMSEEAQKRVGKGES